MRKLFVVVFAMILCSLLFIWFQTPAFAEDSGITFENIDYTKQSNIRVVLDDKSIEFDVNPQIVDGRTLVPMRAILEALDLNVSWDATTKTAKGENANYSVSFVLGSKSATVNGQLKTLDVPANVINSRTMIPLRFLSEDMGYNVVWVGDSRLILLSKSNIIEWRYGDTSPELPYREIENEYVNGIKTGKAREVESEFEKDINKRLIANGNVPLLISNDNVTNENGFPVVSFDFTNLDVKNIIAFEFKFDGYDDFGRPVKYLGIGTHTCTAYIQSTQGRKLYTGYTYGFSWDIKDRPGITNVKNIRVTELLYEDGNIWSVGGKSNSTIIEQDSNNSYVKERLSQYESDLADLRSQIAAAKENKNVRVMSGDQGWIWTYDRSVVSRLEKEYQDLNDSYRLFKASNSI